MGADEDYEYERLLAVDEEILRLIDREGRRFEVIRARSAFEIAQLELGNKARH